MPSPRRPTHLRLSMSGAVGDGTTNDSAAINTWLASIGPYHDIDVDRMFYVPGGFTPPSFTTFHGTRAGGLLGSSAYLTSPVPIPTTKISASGVFSGTGTPYSSTISHGAYQFTVANSFAAEQYVMVRNYPTDATTDAFVTNSDGSRSYPNGSISAYEGKIDAANKRQTRRIEPAKVRTASGSSLELYSPLQFDYASTDGLEFAPFAPVSDIRFNDVYVRDIYIDTWMSDNMQWIGGKLHRSTFSVGRGMNGKAIEFDLEAENTDNFVGGGRSAVNLRITGKTSGGSISSDNGAVRIDQAGNFFVDITSSGHKSGFYAFIGDTNYAEDPGDASGRAYPDVPLRNGRININDSGSNMACFLSCNPHAAMVENIILDVVAQGNPSGQAVFLNGCKRVRATLEIPDANLRIEGSTRVYLDGDWATFYASGPDAGLGRGNGSLADPRGVASPILNSIQRLNSSNY